MSVRFVWVLRPNKPNRRDVTELKVSHQLNHLNMLGIILMFVFLENSNLMSYHL